MAEQTDRPGEGDRVRLTVEGEVVGVRGYPVYPEDRVRIELPDGGRVAVDPEHPAVEVEAVEEAGGR